MMEFYSLLEKKWEYYSTKRNFTDGKIPFVLRLPKKKNNNKVRCRPAHYVLAGKNCENA